MAFPQPFFRWRPHPRHGLSAGPDTPALVNAYIEMTPFDVVKYEVDKSLLKRCKTSMAFPPDRGKVSSVQGLPHSDRLLA